MHLPDLVLQFVGSAWMLLGDLALTLTSAPLAVVAFVPLALIFRQLQVRCAQGPLCCPHKPLSQLPPTPRQVTASLCTAWEALGGMSLTLSSSPLAVVACVPMALLFRQLQVCHTHALSPHNPSPSSPCHPPHQLATPYPGASHGC